MSQYTPLLKLYFETLNKLKEEHENDILLLFQVGSFYEAYGYENDTTSKCAEKLDYQYNNKKDNIYFFGFLKEGINKVLRLLLSENIIIITYDEVHGTKNKDMLDRKKSGIYTPSIYLGDDKIENNNLGIVYYDEYSLGIAIIDNITGFNKIYEYHSKKIIKNELYNYISKLNLNEVIFYSENKYNNYYNDIKNKIKTFNRWKCIPEEYKKRNYREGLLNKIYKNYDLYNYREGTIALCLLLNYLYKYNEKLLNDICIPKIEKLNPTLNLINDSIEQLSILPDLYNILNNAKTILGKNKLKEELINPLIDENVIIERYNKIDKLMKDNILLENIEKLLKNIYNFPKLCRRIKLELIHPYEIYKLYISCFNIIELYKLLNEEYNFEIEKLYKDINKIFNCDYLKNNHIKISEINIDIFNVNDDEKINEMLKNCTNETNILQSMKKKYEDLYYDSDSIEKKEIMKLVKKRDTWYINTTIKRWEKIESKLSKEELNELDIKKSATVINIKTNIKHDKININNCYYELLNKIKIDNNIVEDISEFIADIDFIYSLTKTSILNKYSKPIIKGDISYINAKNIRHPIVEKNNDENCFIPNDFNSNKSILLFGVNGGGKSVYLKSIGILIIMAQIGCYVPAEYMEYYPYNNIITRISYDDDLKKGKSTYAVEASELIPIISNIDRKTLILGDEICKGTEIYSAMSIVIETIKTLCNNKITFILSTHLHNIINYIDKIENLSIKHFEIDPLTLKYDRKLKNGTGNSFYGIEILKTFSAPNDFIHSCFETRKNILKEPENLLMNKTSRYNNNIYIDKCHICGKRTTDTIYHTHHIHEQKNADENNLIINDGIIFHKNKKFNLMVLCVDCHHKQHL